MIDTWGPARDAEIAYRQAEVRRVYAEPPIRVPRAPWLASRLARLRALVSRRPVPVNGDGERQTALSGSEAWPAL